MTAESVISELSVGWSESRKETVHLVDVRNSWNVTETTRRDVCRPGFGHDCGRDTGLSLLHIWTGNTFYDNGYTYSQMFSNHLDFFCHVFALALRCCLFSNVIQQTPEAFTKQLCLCWDYIHTVGLSSLIRWFPKATTGSWVFNSIYGCQNKRAESKIFIFQPFPL